MRYFILLPLLLLLACTQSFVATEVDGYVFVEAEDFKLNNYPADNKAREWHKIKPTTKQAGGDSDPSHASTASGTAYLEALPDTRVTHDDELIPGTNFSNEPGKIALLGYPIRFENPGRYYVWVRAYSSGAEDNGIHVGLNGEWPESGQRLQWCEGKNKWTWESKQRTLEVHCGVEKLIYLDIPSSGIHTITFSLREDGFEFDAFVLSKEYVSPGERP
jgi:hypothetical protein